MKGFLLVVIIGMMTFPSPVWARGDISDEELAEFSLELTDLRNHKGSSASKRRAYKNLIRDGEKVYDKAGESPRRFEMLALILKAQQVLLSLDDSSRNKKALFDTCELLTNAPDSMAQLRFSAEMLLMERDLAEKEADVKTRASALEELVGRYRNTPGELNSLISGIRLAPQIDAFELKEKFVTGLVQRFAGHPRAIALRRKLMGSASLDILFAGEFDATDGRKMKFPMDRLGHPYIVVFWSKESPLIEKRFQELKQEQDKSPGRFELYSLNLDDMEDAGESFLKSFGLEFTALRLPGGINSDAYRTYALTNFFAFRVNKFGHAIVPPSMKAQTENEIAARKEEEENLKKAGDGKDHLRGHGSSTFNGLKYPETFLGEDRVIRQVQSLLIGDVLLNREPLITETGAGSKVPQELLTSIRTVIPVAPDRYRMERQKSLGLYVRLNQLTANGIKANANAVDLWRLFNYRIVALMGMYNFTGRATLLDEAVKVSSEILKKPIPAEAKVIPLYCLAKKKLRAAQVMPHDILADFVNQAKDDKLGPYGYGAATLLTLHTDSRELFSKYSEEFLDRADTGASLDELIAYLQSRFHNFYIFSGSAHYYLYSREYRFKVRRYHIDNGDDFFSRALPKLVVKTLDSKEIDLSNEKSDKISYLAFVEPSEVENLHVNQAIYTMPKVKEPSKRDPNPKPYRTGMISTLMKSVKSHANQEMDLTTVFLSNNQEQVSALVDKYNWPGRVVISPEGNKSNALKRLGVNSADRIPHVILLRRDRSIAWIGEGNEYPYMRGGEYVTSVAIENNIFRIEAEAGYRALKERDYKSARKHFSAFNVNGIGSRGGHLHKWSPSLFFGKALAHLGEENWDEALVDIEHAISEHRKYFNHDLSRPASCMIGIKSTKADILEALERKTEARSLRSDIAIEPTHYPTYYSRIRGYNVPYELFNQRLSTVLEEKK